MAWHYLVFTTKILSNKESVHGDLIMPLILSNINPKGNKLFHISRIGCENNVFILHV